MFVQKIKTYHAAAGKASLYRAQTPGLRAYRVTPVKNRRYAVVHPAAGIRLRQGGRKYPFSQKERGHLYHTHLHTVHWCVIKIKTSHAAAGEASFHLVKRPVA